MFLLFFHAILHASLLFVAGEDFGAIPVSLTVSNATPESCFAIPVINDNAYELREEFFINLTSKDPAVNVIQNNKIIMILDDDSKYWMLGEVE